MRARGVLLLLMLGASAAAAAPVPPDTTARALPSVAGDPLAPFRADETFRYEEAPPRPGVFAAVIDRIEEILSRIYGGRNGEAASWATIVVFALVIAALFMRLVGAFAPPTAPRGGATADGGEALPARVDALDFSAWLAEARADGDHRRAVRAVYLRALQTLDRTGAVPYRADRTNDGVVRLLAPERRPAFRRLARTFERAWYGALPQAEADVETALAAEAALLAPARAAAVPEGDAA